MIHSHFLLVNALNLFILVSCSSMKTLLCFIVVELMFQIESTDLEKRTVKMSIFWNHISTFFKKIEATVTVTPTVPSCLAWSVDFEKISYDIVDPMWIVSTLLEYIRSTDVYNLYELNHKVNFIDTEYTADECFKAFIGAVKDDGKRFYFDWSFSSYF